MPRQRYYPEDPDLVLDLETSFSEVQHVGKWICFHKELCIFCNQWKTRVALNMNDGTVVRNCRACKKRSRNGI